MKIKEFLNAVKKDINAGTIYEVYNKLKITDVGEVEVIELFDVDGQGTDKLDSVVVSYYGDSSIGEGDLNFMEFDETGKFTKQEDYEAMKEELELDKLKESIEKNFYLLKNEATAYVKELEFGSHSSFSVSVDKVTAEEYRITLNDSLMVGSGDVDEFLEEFNDLLKKYFI